MAPSGLKKNVYESVWSYENVNEFKERLAPREREAFELRLKFGRARTLADIGTMMGISPSTVSKYLNAVAGKANCGADELDYYFLNRGGEPPPAAT